MMRTNRKMSRRRFLRITGLAGFGAASLSLLDHGIAAEASVPAWTWRGVVMGADASVSLHGLSEAKASRLTLGCFEELRRLEKLFSLYDPDSAVCRLNRQGYLLDPPPELVRLLLEARSFSKQTGGAFDVSVQPLWVGLRDHFKRTPTPPPATLLRELLVNVDYRGIQVSRRRIAFRRSGMAVTLNGIAQGWITDRIAEYLQREGVSSTLINIGEYRALGMHPENRPWRLGVRGSDGADDLLDTVPLEQAALAVSGGHGHPFADLPGAHHLVHPRTGLCQPTRRTIALVARTATEADALSTACAVVDDEAASGFARDRAVRLRLFS